MFTYLLLSKVYASENDEINPPQSCEDLCFCPCHAPDDTERVINPSQNCLAQIDCRDATLECNALVMACEEQEPKELCFCPCRIPGWCFVLSG